MDARAGYRFKLPPAKLAPNPIWETNSHLSELTSTVSQLAEIAQQHAELVRQQSRLSQSISTNAELALTCAIQSGDDAKAATRIARKSIGLIWTTIIIVIVCGVLNYELSNSEDVRLREEIRLLGEISRNMQQLNDRPVAKVRIAPQTAATP